MAPGQNWQVLLLLVILGLFGVACYRLLLWLKKPPQAPDPWGKEVDQALEQEGAVPVCHHCLTPQHHNGWFCPECGATVGPYCNYLPYIYIFSQGEVLRAGATERLQHSALIVVGYLLFSLFMFSILAPIYWWFFFRNFYSHPRRKAPEPPPI